MLHSHTYIQDAKYTESVLPCGAVEEFDQIIKTNPSQDSKYIAVNIIGHGSILMASDINCLNAKWIARTFPEFV